MATLCKRLHDVVDLSEYCPGGCYNTPHQRLDIVSRNMSTEFIHTRRALENDRGHYFADLYVYDQYAKLFGFNPLINPIAVYLRTAYYLTVVEAYASGRPLSESTIQNFSAAWGLNATRGIWTDFSEDIKFCISADLEKRTGRKQMAIITQRGKRGEIQAALKERMKGTKRKDPKNKDIFLPKLSITIDHVWAFRILEQFRKTDPNKLDKKIIAESGCRFRVGSGRHMAFSFVKKFINTRGNKPQPLSKILESIPKEIRIVTAMVAIAEHLDVFRLDANGNLGMNREENYKPETRPQNAHSVGKTQKKSSPKQVQKDIEKSSSEKKDAKKKPEIKKVARSAPIKKTPASTAKPAAKPEPVKKKNIGKGLKKMAEETRESPVLKRMQENERQIAEAPPIWIDPIEEKHVETIEPPAVKKGLFAPLKKLIKK